MRAYFEIITDSMRWNGGGVDVIATDYADFRPCRPQLHPTLPGLWICGYWFGKVLAVGNGDATPVALGLSPLPQQTSLPYLPTLEAYWMVLGCSLEENSQPWSMVDWLMVSDEDLGDNVVMRFEQENINHYYGNRIPSWLGKINSTYHNARLWATPWSETIRPDIYILDGATQQILEYVVSAAGNPSYQYENSSGAQYILMANGIILKPEEQLIRERLLDPHTIITPRRGVNEK